MTTLNMKPEHYLYELRGYLQALSRLSSPRCHFWAEILPIETDLPNVVDEYIASFPEGTKCLEQVQIDSNEMNSVLTEHLYSHLKNPDENQVKLFDWDINEYFDLISIAQNPNGNFYPHVANDAIKLVTVSQFHKSLTYCFIEIGDIAIAVCFGIRKA